MDPTPHQQLFEAHDSGRQDVRPCYCREMIIGFICLPVGFFIGVVSAAYACEQRRCPCPHAPLLLSGGTLSAV